LEKEQVESKYEGVRGGLIGTTLQKYIIEGEEE